jgi:hypothetical protein
VTPAVEEQLRMNLIIHWDKIWKDYEKNVWDVGKAKKYLVQLTGKKFQTKYFSSGF